MINCQRIHDGVSYRLKRTRNVRDLAYILVWTPLNQSPSNILSFFLSRCLAPFCCPTRYVSFVLSLPRQRDGTLIHLPSLSIFVSSSLSLFFSSSLVLYGRPSTRLCPFVLLFLLHSEARASRRAVYLVSCKSARVVSLTNDSNFEGNSLLPFQSRSTCFCCSFLFPEACKRKIRVFKYAGCSRCAYIYITKKKLKKK